jgi:hypothetical protein
MKIKSSYLMFFVAAGIGTATLLSASPSKAILYIDFIRLSDTQTRIKASGTINPFLLSPFSGRVTPNLDSAGTDSSRINLNQDLLRFSYSPSLIRNVPSRLFAIVGGTTNPFTGVGGNTIWSVTTPANNPPFGLRFGGDMDITLSNAFTGITTNASTPINQAKTVDAFFDVNKSLAQIGLAAPVISYTSGSEQIILREITATPGPVPFLGAAAAFGYSRRLRNRIQKNYISPSA